MKVTNSAIEIILDIMQKRGLDPSKTFLEVRLLENGALGFGFTRDRLGKLIKFGDLSVIEAFGTETSDTVIDFGEVNGKKGLIFLSEEEYNQIACNK